LAKTGVKAKSGRQQIFIHQRDTKFTQSTTACLVFALYSP
jgi:hypothetical protein